MQSGQNATRALTDAAISDPINNRGVRSGDEIVHIAPSQNNIRHGRQFSQEPFGYFA